MWRSGLAGPGWAKQVGRDGWAGPGRDEPGRGKGRVVHDRACEGEDGAYGSQHILQGRPGDGWDKFKLSSPKTIAELVRSTIDQ
jgi:hypothetical protein